ncbi:MAG: hypothetical protein IPK72_23445 [Candidatus Eisenbacteria bacterium]|nr:hypothetical protein [Candidatus Eisenbacteria bacterium]
MILLWVLGSASADRAAASLPDPAAAPPWGSSVPPVYDVLFTHIEDNTPSGPLGSPQSRQNYLVHRNALLAMGTLAQSYEVPWSLQPDWKILRAALLYEDSAMTANTGGKNFLRFLREDLGVVIDPHSHENGGYNYTDVAHLLDSLGVGGTTVIGGHIWDPALPQFQEWDRYRVPVAGLQFPWAEWRGDVLMGSGTPGHVNDPLVSGVWRPRDRDHYFEDEETGNIVAVGQWRGLLSGASELHQLYVDGTVPQALMLTCSEHINPSKLIAPGGLAALEDTLIAPLAALRAEGIVELTDFTSLIDTWRTNFGSVGFVYDPETVTGVELASGEDVGDPRDPRRARGADPLPHAWLEACGPNPTSGRVEMRYQVRVGAAFRITILDAAGREVVRVRERVEAPGSHTVDWEAGDLPSGAYYVAIAEVAPGLTGARMSHGQPRAGAIKILLLR